jgi:hypothetical protein
MIMIVAHAVPMVLKTFMLFVITIKLSLACAFAVSQHFAIPLSSSQGNDGDMMHKVSTS